MLLQEAEDGGDDDFLGVLGAERKALIFRDDGEGGSAASASAAAAGADAWSYSSIRFARSSSEVIETNASRSSVGNWHLRITEVPHISPSFAINSIIEQKYE